MQKIVVFSRDLKIYLRAFMLKILKSAERGLITESKVKLKRNRKIQKS